MPKAFASAKNVCVLRLSPEVFDLLEGVRLCLLLPVGRNYAEGVREQVAKQWRTQEFCSGGGSINSVLDSGQRERGSGGGSPLLRGSRGSCNLVKEISFHIVKIFLIFGTLRLFMLKTNLFVIANVKQLRTDDSFTIFVPFFQKSWGVGVLN